jgi:anti-sigma B factor antagonist
MAFTSPGLEIRRQHVEDHVLISLRGELDLASAAGLERELRGVTDDQRGRISIDLNELEFMDSAGLKILVQAQRNSSAGHSLVLVRASRQVRRLIELAGLNGYFILEAE